MSAYDDIAVNSASSTRQADRYRKAVEQEMASPSGTTYVGAYAMFHEEQRRTCAVHVLGWISMLLSFLLLILWVVISFFAGVALQVFADVREAGPYLIGYLVVSILAAVLYLLMTLFVAVFTCRAPFCGCARSTVVKPSLCSVLTFVLLFLLSCVLSVLAGVSIKDALTAGKIRDPVIAAFVFMILCTVVFMIYFILWSVRGVPRE
ncbi:hypothetical protein NESM_000822300 [Novymonas esmeraldas]|uniref:MARVEL domain-containing protein n=1 Tax=Novymonas esmeraldas TaxID=1808958 RepID=A0AAW0EWV8_9TRYP